jgi:cytosine/adenosine deaminase-related metal-dependent hydrolase
MRLLHARDGTDPALLLRMATLNGARALGLPDRLFTLAPGSTPAGILAVDVSGTPADVSPLGRVLQSRRPPANCTAKPRIESAPHGIIGYR